MATDNNQAAPAPQADNDSKAVDSAPQAADSTEVVKSSTDNTTASVESAFDPQTSYQSLVKELQTVNKSYGDLRREFTRRTQYESELKKQIESLSKAFAEASKEEISPEEFIKNLQSQGIKAFDPLRQQWTKEIQDSHEQALSQRDQEIVTLKTNFEVMRRELDATNYPDFAKLKPLMNEIAQSDQCPVDWNQEPGVIYDTLYKLARDLKAEESVKQAREIGRKEAEAQTAKEANAAVAGGGKAGSITNPSEIKDLKKLREFFVSQIGEAE